VPNNVAADSKTLDDADDTHLGRWRPARCCMLCGAIVKVFWAQRACAEIIFECAWWQFAVDSNNTYFIVEDVASKRHPRPLLRGKPITGIFETQNTAVERKLS
jgi:hypothetical protein